MGLPDQLQAGAETAGGPALMLANLSEGDRRTLRLGGFGVVAILIVVLVVFPLMDLYQGAVKREKVANDRIRATQAAVSEAAEGAKALKELRDRAMIYDDRIAVNEQTARML